jgi:hypothetical protein
MRIVAVAAPHRRSTLTLLLLLLLVLLLLLLLMLVVLVGCTRYRYYNWLGCGTYITWEFHVEVGHVRQGHVISKLISSRS